MNGFQGMEIDRGKEILGSEGETKGEENSKPAPFDKPNPQWGAAPKSVSTR